MYIKDLNEADQSKFIELAYKAANADAKFTDKEIIVFSEYKKEVGITKVPITGSKDELIDYFAKASLKTKKIVVFELYGMFLANDGHMHEAGRAFIADVVAKFGLDEETVKNLRLAALDLEVAYFYAHKLVME